MSAPPPDDGGTAAGLAATDIYTLWRTRGAGALRSLPDGTEVVAPRMEARAFSDFADLLLGLFGPRRWEWRDASGRRGHGAAAPVAAINLALDAVAVPWLAWRHRRRAARLRALARPPRPRHDDGAPLYLRMDHLFDLAAGGSVAHTAGVLNALRTLVGPVDVVSTDRLAMVEPDERFHVLVPRYRRGRNVPNVPLLTYNDQVLAYCRRLEGRPRFVYGRYSLGSYAGLALAAQAGAPYVCEYNGSSIWIARHWGGRPLHFEAVMQTIEDANLFGADLVVAVSRASADELAGRGVPRERILVNPNGVDPDRFGAAVADSAARVRLGIGTDEIVIGFIGTFGRWHGAEVLARAFVRLLANAPQLRDRLRLLLIGDGNTMPAVRAILADGGAMDRALLPGIVPQEQAPDWLAACDVLASPHVPNPDGTPFFGSPTKLFEYMAAARAIVASRLDQVGEVLADGETAVLVPPGDEPALAAAMHDLAADPQRRERLARAARAACLAHHTWGRHTERILDALAAAA